jgi:hypothetical protein
MVDFDDKLFWIGRRGWPANAYGYVFLGEAVAQLGKALFPAEWTGAEMVAEAPYPRDGLYIDGAEGNAPKPRFWSEPRLIDVLARVLRENHPDIEIRYTPGHSRGPVLTDEQHMAALLTIERVNPIRIAALARMAKVTQTLEHALRDGKIKFALLPTRGGEFIPETKPSWWNIPSTAHRWTRCQLSPADPYSVAIAGTGFMHIFVDAANFASFVAGFCQGGYVTHAPAAPTERKSNEILAF